MKRIIAALFLAGFATIAFALGDPYRMDAGESEADKVVRSYGG